MEAKSVPAAGIRLAAAGLYALLLWGCGSSAVASLIINEVDYDQPGSDAGEFIELLNNAAAPLALGGYLLELINGSSGTPYRSLALPDTTLIGGGYFVLCGDPAQVVNCDLDLSPDANLIQNGAPDGLALLLADEIVDSVIYEGSISGYGQGTPVAGQDSNAIAYLSLGRLPDGSDSGDDGHDFALTCSTPGYPNGVADGVCSAPRALPVRATVAEPAVHGLLSAGLLLLLGSRLREALSVRRAMPPLCR